jgi:hypothetical protein
MEEELKKGESAEALTVEGQKPDAVIPYEENGKKWVFRIPRRADVFVRAQNEKKILEFVRTRISVNVPDWKIVQPDLIAYPMLTDNPGLTFDSSTGEITEVQLYKDLPKSGKIRGWIYSVHVGSWGGMTTRILTCLVSLLGTIFAITGYYFWIKKQFRKLR